MTSTLPHAIHSARALLLAAAALLGCGGDAMSESSATEASTTASSADATTGATTGGSDSDSEATRGSDTDTDGGSTRGSVDECLAETAQVELDNAFGTLYGTLSVPEGCGPHPVVLFHAGSGPTDRDGNSPDPQNTNDSLKLLAEALQERGVASLRYDKRGIAASVDAGPSDPSEFRFEDFADDLSLWIEFVRADAARFGPLTLLGHSEGSLIAMVASGATAPDRLISLAGFGRPAGDVLRTQLMAQLDGPLLEEALAIITSLESGETVDEVSPELQGLFGPAVQPYIISWFAYDPAPVLAGLTMPTLIAAGTTDIQVSVDDAALLAQARPDAAQCIVEGMNHVLKAATLDPDSQAQAYMDPSLPVVPALVDCVAEFVLNDDG